MSLIYGIEAIQQQASANLPHVLGFQTARSASDDTLFEIWNASTNAGIVAAVDLNGKFYSAALTAGDIQYAVTGGVSNVLRLDSLAIGTAAQALVVNSGATAPEWVTLDATRVAAGTFPSGSFVFQGAVSGVTTLAVEGSLQTGSAISIVRSFGGDSGTKYGMFVSMSDSVASGNSRTGFHVQNVMSHTSGTHSADILGLEVVVGLAQTGTITNTFGIRVGLDTFASGTMTNAYYLHIDNSLTIDSSVIGTQYGLYVTNIDKGSTNYAIYTGTGLVRFGDSVEIDGDLNHDGSNIGFFGTAPTTIQDVTGSRGSNAALASLLTALAAYGILTDSSS